LKIAEPISRFLENNGTNIGWVESGDALDKKLSDESFDMAMWRPDRRDAILSAHCRSRLDTLE